MTKLYLANSLDLQFDAILEAVSSWQEQPSLILNQSAFYPESGGQLGDKGLLCCGEYSYTVTDTQYDDAGQTHHLVDKLDPPPQPGSPVHGEVDFAARRDMMSQHTGQHLLSAVCQKELGADTVSSRLGASIATLDLDLKEITSQQVAHIQEVANNLVLENRPVRVHYPNEAELKAMNLRRTIKVSENIRILEIEGYDFTPCGGTHCTATGQIGPIYITSRERAKGNVRLNFLCGSRMLAYSSKLDRQLQQLGEQLGCGAAGVDESVTRLQKDLRQTSMQLGETRSTLMGYLSESLLAEHPAGERYTPIISIQDNGDPAALRALASGLARRDDVVALVFGPDENGAWRVVVEAGEASNFNAGLWFRNQGKQLGGRGGGRPQHAEGRFPAEFNPAQLRVET